MTFKTFSCVNLTLSIKKLLKCRQLCKVYRFYSYRFYSIDIFIYLFEVTCFRCNLQTFLNVFSLKIVIFKREYLETEVFSDYTVEEKNAPFFLNFPNMYKLWSLLSDRSKLSYLLIKLFNKLNNRIIN